MVSSFSLPAFFRYDTSMHASLAFRFAHPAAVVATILAIGCGDDAGGTDAVDGGQADSSVNIDASVGGCSERALEEDLGTRTDITFGARADDQGNASGPVLLRVFGTIDPGMAPQPKADIFDIRFFEARTLFAAGFATGTYELTGDETDFYRCGACIHILADSNLDGTAQDYMLASGTLELTMISRAIGQMVEGTLTNATFREVTLDGAVQTDVADGCTSQMASVSFSALIQ